MGNTAIELYQDYPKRNQLRLSKEEKTHMLPPIQIPFLQQVTFNKVETNSYVAVQLKDISFDVAAIFLAL
jgi:hypothetical protein